MNLRDAECEIQAALERLRAKPESCRPFVVIDVVSPRWTDNKGPFVQFFGSAQRSLVLDVPLTEQKLVRSLPFLAYRQTEWGIEEPVETELQGANAAINVLKIGFDVGLDEGIEITEHAEGTGIA